MRQVYETPNSIFVAKFIGDINIFDAIVVKVSPKYTEVLIEDKIPYKITENNGWPTATVVGPYLHTTVASTIAPDVDRMEVGAGVGLHPTGQLCMSTGTPAMFPTDVRCM